MGSRARTATAACVLASGLLIWGGASSLAVAVAFADTPSAEGGTPTAAVDRAGDAADPSAAVDGERPVKSRRAATDPVDAPDDPPKPGPSADDPQAGGGDRWPPCCERGEDGCEPGWHWPWPVDPDDISDDDSDYGEGRPVTLPPAGPMPATGGTGGAGVLDTVPGVGAGQGTQAPISVPIIVTNPVGFGPVAAPRVADLPSAAPGGAGPPLAPRQPVEPSPASVRTAPSPRQLSPETTGSGTATPASMSRIGYAEHLRSAGLPQLAAFALPGLAGILVLTGAGGLVGYRQARAAQGVHPTGMVRFMNEK